VAQYARVPGPLSSNRRAQATSLRLCKTELADGNSVRSDAADLDAVLSRFFRRDVNLRS
jgi:hypothetical protein